MEDYAAKMQLKPDAALRDYVTGHAQYLEAAVLAALDELRRRGQPAPEEAALRPALEAAVAATPAAPAAETRRPTDAVAADEAAAGPALYSPGTILMFSLFFSMLAGGVLLGLNLAALRRWRALGGLAVFLVVYLAASTAVVSWFTAQYGVHPMLSLLLNVPAIAAYLLWFWPRYVGAGVEEYRSRAWLPALVVCMVVAVGIQMGSKYLLKQQPKAVQQEMEKYLGK